MKRVIGLIAAAFFLIAFAGCSEQKTIVFSDAGWDSIKFHNAVAGFIAKTAYGYDEWSEIMGSSVVLHEGIIKGEVDVNMEVWTDNLATYKEDLAQGKLKELGVNFDDNMQGIYVPRYVIEGDTQRGIKPMAPELRTVEDLKKYKDVFADDEQKDKGRIYGAIPGWEIDQVMYKKYMHYGLDENFVYFRPGSEAAMNTSFSTAYEKGKPIAGYYWEPTWILGKYDFVLLEDAPYDAKDFKEGKTACPSIKVAVGASNRFSEKDPEYCKFLKNYKTSSKLTSEALAHIQETGDDYNKTAIWFLTQNDELLDQWLEPEKADIVRDALKKGDFTWSQISEFPFKLPIDLASIDKAVVDFSVKFDGFFGAVKSGLNGLISGIYYLLELIPWWVLVIGVFFAGYKLSGKLKTGLIYSVMLMFVGAVGFWQLMNETLSIVISSVIIALALGFVIGILIADSDRANRIIRPILDTMQTMPVFVYLIPAIIFFGLGKAPAVIATTIYAIVPIIRLTSHGIRQVDVEVVEAAKAFGSTRFQTLWKVQIPQAMPTIMTGVNQTLMMAMAMVVTCSMIGASGLGMEVLIGVNRREIGRGLIAGIAVVIVAILMDRLTQGCIKNSEVKANVR